MIRSGTPQLKERSLITKTIRWRKAMVTLEDDVATAKRMLEFNAGDWKILMVR